MVGTIALAAVMASAALSSAALPALAPIAELPPEHKEEIATVGFVKQECSAETLRFVKNATNNIDVLVSEYNSVISADMQKMNVEFVEYSKPVYIIEEEKYGVYLDFNDSNGYVVMTDDNVMYALNTTDDLKYLRDAGELYFSVFDGFMYLDEDGNLSSYKSTEDNFSAIRTMSNANSTGGSSGRSPVIDKNKLNEYMLDYYPDYVLSTKVDKLSSTFDYEQQFHTAYYKSNQYEGNCALHASYMTLRSWCKQGFVDIPGYANTVDITASIKNDPLYAKYGVGNEINEVINEISVKGIWRCNDNDKLSIMPMLYTNIRDYAINNGYTIMNYVTQQIPNTIKHVANTKYGNNVSVLQSYDYIPTRINLVDRKASIISVHYGKDGGHSAAVIGVYEYVKKSDYNSFGINHYIRIYLVADGSCNSLRYYDPNGDSYESLVFTYLNSISASNPTLPRC